MLLIALREDLWQFFDTGKEHSIMVWSINDGYFVVGEIGKDIKWGQLKRREDRTLRIGNEETEDKFTFTRNEVSRLVGLMCYDSEGGMGLRVLWDMAVEKVERFLECMSTYDSSSHAQHEHVYKGCRAEVPAYQCCCKYAGISDVTEGVFIASYVKTMMVENHFELCDFINRLNKRCVDQGFNAQNPVETFNALMRKRPCDISEYVINYIQHKRQA